MINFNRWIVLYWAITTSYILLSHIKHQTPVWIARYWRKVFAKGVKEYTEKILSHIPELYPDIKAVKFNVQEDHIYMVVVILPRIAVADAIRFIKTQSVKRTQSEISFYVKNPCKERRHLVKRILCIVYRLE